MRSAPCDASSMSVLFTLSHWGCVRACADSSEFRFRAQASVLQFTVDDILKDSPASYSQIQIGDRLRMVSSACDESASAAQSEQAHRLRRRRKKREKVCLLANLLCEIAG